MTKTKSWLHILFLLCLFQSFSYHTFTQENQQKCSQQNAIPIEKFWNGLGARGNITSDDNSSWSGWALFDTGATYSRIRHPYKLSGDDEVNNPNNHKLSFGKWQENQSMTFSPTLWNQYAPRLLGDAEEHKGHQIATIGTSIIKNWAFRIDEDKMYFSEYSKSCSNEELKSQGYKSLDTSGFYQLKGQQMSVSSSFASPTIPTVWVEIQGIRIPAQIDTGYQVKFGENFVQINEPLLKLIKNKLPTLNQFGNYFLKNDGLVFFASKNSSEKVAFLNDVYLTVKKVGGGGIAEWEIPAAMISAPAFFNTFKSSEFRADNNSVWVKAR